MVEATALKGKKIFCTGANLIHGGDVNIMRLDENNSHKEVRNE